MYTEMSLFFQWRSTTVNSIVFCSASHRIWCLVVAHNSLRIRLSWTGLWYFTRCASRLGNTQQHHPWRISSNILSVWDPSCVRKRRRYSMSIGNGFYNLTICNVTVNETADYACNERQGNGPRTFTRLDVLRKISRQNATADHWYWIG